MGTERIIVQLRKLRQTSRASGYSHKFTHTCCKILHPLLLQIERLRSENKLPIVVGGTNYYIEQLLWKMMDFRDTDSYVADADKFEFISKFESWTSEDLHKKLRDVDENYAKMLHPRDRRKILK